MMAFDLIIKYRQGLLAGLGVTLQLCLIVWLTGLAIGAALSLASTRWPHSIGRATQLVSFLLTGIPLLVFLFWLHYPAQAMLGVIVHPFYTAALMLSILNIFAVNEAIRGVLSSFPAEFVSIARACGMRAPAILRYVQLPLVLRQAVPSLLVIQVNVLQATLFASLISVEEVFRVVQRINAVENRPVAVYTSLGLLFLAVCLPLNGVARWLQQRYSHDFSER